MAAVKDLELCVAEFSAGVVARKDLELRVAAFAMDVVAVKDRELRVAVLSAGVAAMKDRELGVAAGASVFGSAGVALSPSSLRHLRKSSSAQYWAHRTEKLPIRPMITKGPHLGNQGISPPEPLSTIVVALENVGSSVGANVGAIVLLIIPIALSTTWRKSLSPTSPSVVFIFVVMVVVVIQSMFFGCDLRAKLDAWQLRLRYEVCKDVCNTYVVLENI